MSEELQTPATPGQPATPETPAVPTPDAGAEQPAGQPEAPAAPPAPFATFADSKAFEKRMDREARKRMNDQAKELGFDDWQHMQSELAATRQPASSAPATPDGGNQPEPETPPGTLSEAARLRLALQVATEMNLPPALVGRLQGDDVEAMKADAQGLVALLQQSQGRVPGIPPAPQGGNPVTFSRAQLQDPKFVREHQAEIQRAGREGRIVN